MNDGGPVFPIQPSHKGVAMRDFFAAAAITGLLARPGTVNGKNDLTIDELAKFAYDTADKMLEVRNASTSA